MFACFSKSLSKSWSLAVLSIYNCIIRLARETLECDYVWAVCWYLVWEGCGRPSSSSLDEPCVLYSSKQSRHHAYTNIDVSPLMGLHGHFPFSWSGLVFIPKAFPTLILPSSSPRFLSTSCLCIPSSCLTSPSFLLYTAAHLSTYSSHFSQPQNASSLASALLSLHLNQLLSLSFQNTKKRMKGRKKSWKKV